MTERAETATPVFGAGASALVVGGTGFVGAHLCRALLVAGLRVTSLGTRDITPVFQAILGEALPDLDVRRGRVDGKDALVEVMRVVRPEIVVHLAATADIARLNREPEIGIRDVNTTFEVLQAARDKGIRRLVYFSSTSALSPLQYEPIDASSPVIDPRHGPAGGIYGACKAAAEVLALSYGEVFELDVRIVRAQSVYGFGMRSSVPLAAMVEGAVRGIPVHLDSGGTFPRDYTHVDDVVSLTTTLIDAGQDVDRIFIPATGRPPSIGAEVARIVRDVVPGCDVTIADTVTDAERIDSRYRGQVSIESARAQLGWAPRYANLRDGVAEYVDRFRGYLRDQAGTNQD